jgi:hypothetical protein
VERDLGDRDPERARIADRAAEMDLRRHGAASVLDREEKPQPAGRLILREAQVEGGRRWPRFHQRAVVLGRVKAEPFRWPLKSGQP